MHPKGPVIRRVSLVAMAGVALLSGACGESTPPARQGTASQAKVVGMPDVVAFFTRERTQQDMESVLTDVLGEEGVACAELTSPSQALEEFRQVVDGLGLHVRREDVGWVLKVALRPEIAYSERDDYARRVVEDIRKHNSLQRVGVSVDLLPQSKWRAPSCREA